MDAKTTFRKTCKSLLNLLLVSITLLNLHILFSFKMSYIEPRIIDIDVDAQYQASYTNNKDILKQDVENLFNFKDYNFIETNDLQINILGKTSFLSKTIILRENLSYTYFVITLSHEITHLSKLTMSERYCHYNTFMKLYYSGNEYFKYCALRLAYDDLCGIVPDNYSFIGNLPKIKEFKYAIN